MAGKDPVAVDATACRMVGLDINSVEYFVPARERGLGNFDEEFIDIQGETIKDVYQPMWMPYLEGFEKFPEYAGDGDDSATKAIESYRLRVSNHLGKKIKSGSYSSVCLLSSSEFYQFVVRR